MRIQTHSSDNRQLPSRVENLHKTLQMSPRKAFFPLHHLANTLPACSRSLCPGSWGTWDTRLCSSHACQDKLYRHPWCSKQAPCAWHRYYSSLHNGVASVSISPCSSPCSSLHNTMPACLSTEHLNERLIKQDVLCSPNEATSAKRTAFESGAAWHCSNFCAHPPLMFVKSPS